MNTFRKLLPKWLYRCGVPHAEIADAVQDSLIEAVTLGDELPTDPDKLRNEMLRIASRVALRTRRQLQRNAARYGTALEDIHAADQHNAESWIEARVLVLNAMERLDKQTQVLIYAHEIEGCTNAEIAVRLGIKEDTVEKRVAVAKKRLRTEIERLLRTRKRAHEGAFMIGLGLVPFDRAVFGAILEAEDKTRDFSCPTKWSLFMRPNLPMAILASSCVLIPGTMLRDDFGILEIKRFASVEWPAISIPEPTTKPLPIPNLETAVKTTAMPTGATRPPMAKSPEKLDKSTLAALRGSGKPGTPP